MTSGTSKNRTILVTDCVEAALEIVDLCRLLRDETGLARASFTEFSSCRAALLVILAQSLTKRTERLREALDKGMGLIKIMSMGVGSARSAVSVIEALERAIRRLEDWSASQGGNQNVGNAESAYDRFKNWEMLWKTGPLSPASVPLPATGNANANDNNNSNNNNNANSKNTPIPVTPITSLNTPPDPMTDISTTTNSHNEHVLGSSDFSPSISGTISSLPHFGFDHFVSNFPQELDEFTAIPCFENEQQQNVQSQAQAQVQAQAQAQAQAQVQAQGPGQGQGQVGFGDSPDNRWMQFINSD